MPLEALSTPKYLVAKEAAEYARMTLRSLHERTSQRTIPFRKLAGSRRLLFTPDDLDAWLDGAPLEVTEKPDGSIIVRPKAQEVTAQLAGAAA